MSVWVSVCMYTYIHKYTHECLWSLNKRTGSPGAGITNICEMFRTTLGTNSSTLKERQSSDPPSHVTVSFFSLYPSLEPSFPPLTVLLRDFISPSPHCLECYKILRQPDGDQGKRKGAPWMIHNLEKNMGVSGCRWESLKSGEVWMFQLDGRTVSIDTGCVMHLAHG